MSSPQTVVFVSGAGRGIGKSLVETYLLRPHHTVIASVRDSKGPQSDSLRSLPTATGSSLLLVSIDSASHTDPAKAVDEIRAAGVSHVDIVIANAGISPTPAQPDAVPVSDVVDCLTVNAVGPVVLYQAVAPLLAKAKQPRWVTVSSGAGSIGNLKEHRASFVTAYGMSKAAANFFTVALHSYHPTWIVYAVHPGLVQTEMGNAGAKMMGLEEAPVRVQDASGYIISSLDNASREKTSGEFLNLPDGNTFPW